MLSLRARIFIIASLIVLVILGVSLLLIIRSKNKTPAPGATTSENLPSGQTTGGQETVAPLAPTAATVRKPTTEEMEKNGVRQIAKIFIERYNTYSTENNFQNIREVQTLVTPALWQALSAKLTGKNQGGNFVGVTTNVVGSELTSWTAGAATAVLQAVRVEERNGTTSNIHSQATVFLVKQGGNWLVNKFNWEK